MNNLTKSWKTSFFEIIRSVLTNRIIFFSNKNIRENKLISYVGTRLKDSLDYI